MNLKGTVTRVFTAKDSGFKILALKVEDLKTIPVEKRNPDYPDSVSVVGLLRGVEENYVIDVVGDWENRPSGQYWPWQFKVSDVTVCEFETPVLMRRFLAGISEVGPELARRIQNVYPNTQEVIEKSPKKLTVIKGITEEKAMRIHRAFLEQKEKRSLAVFLHKFGLKNEDANKISSHYGSNAMKLIREDPYRLCNDNLYPFKLCDRIGKELGIKVFFLGYVRVHIAAQIYGIGFKWLHFLPPFSSGKYFFFARPNLLASCRQRRLVEPWQFVHGAVMIPRKCSSESSFLHIRKVASVLVALAQVEQVGT